MEHEDGKFKLMALVATTAVLSALAGLTIGLQQNPDPYEDIYLQMDNGSQEYCIPEGWAQAFNPEESEPRNSITFNNPDELCAESGDTVELTLTLDVTEDGVEVKP